jgi:methionyl-tRNA formyltransferase
MRVIFTGSGEFGLPTLSALLQAGHEIAAVYTQPSRPAGRGRKLTPTPVGEFAAAKSLAVVETPDINSEKLPPADVMVVIAFGQKLVEGIVNGPRLGSVNLHASILPKYRGAAPINWAIVRGETETGNSIIRMAQKMDGGAILAQSRVSIGETETAGELHDRLAKDGAGLMVKTLEELEAGRIKELPQDETKATIAPKLSREAAKIDWNSSAAEISRRIRGFYPWPGCRVRLVDAQGKECARLTLVRASVVESEGPRWHLGEITIYGDVACGSGGVRMIELQPDGKRVMGLADFQRGHSWMPGMRLESV